jgi:hypothetical protein
MFSPGDVVWFLSGEANKPKFHLCINREGHFLFINSPKKKAYPADFNIPCSDLPFLDPTPEGYSIISCNLVIKQTAQELRSCKAKKKGTVSNKILLRLIAFVDKTPVLSEEEKDVILEGLADWA